ncbi:MAG: hypothetical protein A2Y76_09785 [Planctomycetes bacterium RBG_13_60_9]|nr:MAG: hypothetical protein A2Y76_09785 [Planctomycetes bacterium RBG_13_60_9]
MKKLPLLICLALLLLVNGTLAFASGTPDAGKAAQPVQVSWLIDVSAASPREYWDLAEETFEKEHPEIDLVLQEFAGPRIQQHVLLLYQTGQLTDILSGATELRNIKGALLEIPKEVKALIRDDIVQVYSREGDHMYELPLSSYMWCNVWYNKTMFDKYGLTVPTTWAQFENICKVLKANGIPPLVTGGPTTQWVTGIVVTQPLLGGMLYNLKGDYSFATRMKSGELKWNGPEVSKVVNWWRSLIDAGYYHEGSYSFTIEQMRDTYLEEKAVMMVDGSWAAKLIQDRAKFEVGWFAMPNEKTRNTTIMGAAAMAFNGATKHPKELTKYMKFMVSDNEIYRRQLLQRSAASVTKVPVIVDVGKIANLQYENSRKWGLVNLVSLEGLTGEKQMPAGFLTTIEKAMQNIVVGASVASELDRVEKEFRELVAKQP